MAFIVAPQVTGVGSAVVAQHLTFATYVDRLVDEQYDGKIARLAKALDIHPSTLSRGIDGGTLGLETLLRLARVAGRDPREVLRIAGKQEDLILLESVVGLFTTELSDIDRALLALPERKKRAAIEMVSDDSAHAVRDGPPALDRRTARAKRTGRAS